ncbi:MAG TPA: hypothetical protein VFB24_13565, partial [Candidatus Binatia bacterium]|nr:hypothetical protein [Candidatus Binatia bacterium]
LIDYLAGIGDIEKVADQAASRQLLTTAITCFELLSGASEGKRGTGVRRLVALLEVIPLDREGAEYASRVRRKLDSKGEGIGRRRSARLIHSAQVD